VLASEIAQQDTVKLAEAFTVVPLAEVAASPPVPVMQRFTRPTANWSPLEAAVVVTMFSGTEPKSVNVWFAVYGPTGSSQG
jgi:hypothetical protein